MCAFRGNEQAVADGRAWSVVAWLCEVPVRDGLDRRNAVMLQVLALFSFAYQLAALGVAAVLARQSPLDRLAFVLVALNCVAMLACWVLVRRGRLVCATWTFVMGGIALVWAGYARWGLNSQLPALVTQWLPLLVGGLLLSRRGLWAIAAAMVCAVLIGAWRDAGLFVFVPTMIPVIGWLALRTIVGLLLAAAILDFSVASLRASAAAARARGDALLRARDRLQLEMQEKERSREQLLHAQRMEAAGRLASGIAHDFNHLLGLVLAYTGRRKRTSDVQALQAALEGAESAARRAAAVSRRLLDFSRSEGSRPELLALGETLQGMWPMLRQLFDPQVALELELAPEPTVIWFDLAQFELLVLSIAANANDAMPEGGRFTVSVRNAGAWVVLELRDTGAGMSEQVRAHCLEPFFTTKPRGQGTGLGLAVSHGLVMAAGGHMEVLSSAGAGTLLRISLPDPGRASLAAPATVPVADGASMEAGLP